MFLPLSKKECHPEYKLCIMPGDLHYSNAGFQQMLRMLKVCNLLILSESLQQPLGGPELHVSIWSDPGQIQPFPPVRKRSGCFPIGPGFGGQHPGQRKPVVLPHLSIRQQPHVRQRHQRGFPADHLPKAGGDVILYRPAELEHGHDQGRDFLHWYPAAILHSFDVAVQLPAVLQDCSGKCG